MTDELAHMHGWGRPGPCGDQPHARRLGIPHHPWVEDDDEDDEGWEDAYHWAPSS